MWEGPEGEKQLSPPPPVGRCGQAERQVGCVQRCLQEVGVWVDGISQRAALAPNNVLIPQWKLSPHNRPAIYNAEIGLPPLAAVERAIQL